MFDFYFRSTPYIHDIQEDVFGSKERPEEELDLDNMCRYNIDLETIPDVILQRANKVFSKHTRYEVKKWANTLIQHYNLMVSTEKPMNLDFARPFSNTSDIVRNVPEASFKSEIEKKLKEKEQRDAENNPDAEKEIYVEKDEEQKMSYTEREKYEEKQTVGIQYERPHAVAFLQRKFINNYYVYKRIFGEIKRRDPKFQPESLLDFGAGLGSGSWAGHHMYNKSLKRVGAIEPNAHMRQLGKFLSKELDPEILWTDSLSMIPGAGSQRGQFDIVLMGYVLPEIPSAKHRELILETLMSRVKKEGYFILVEYGTPKGFRFINDFRDKIIEMSRDEVNIVAPCPHHKKCPLASNPSSWCHFSQLVQKFPKDIFPKHPKERQHTNEKFSYLVVKKGKTPRQKYETEEDTRTIEERTYFWSRIIRPNIKEAGHVHTDLCTTDGTFERRIIAKSHKAEGGYSLSRRVKWGDLWRYHKRIPHKFRKAGNWGKRLW